MNPKDPRARAIHTLINYESDMRAIEARCHEARARDERAYQAQCHRREAAFQREYRNKKIQRLNALNTLADVRSGDSKIAFDYTYIFSFARPPAADPCPSCGKPPTRAPDCYPQVIDGQRRMAAAHMLLHDCGHRILEWKGTSLSRPRMILDRDIVNYILHFGAQKSS
jgi:hypothetical protein